MKPLKGCRNLTWPAMSDSDVELHESSSEPEAGRCAQNVSLQREITQILSKLDDEEAAEKKQLDALSPFYRNAIPKELKLKRGPSFFCRDAVPSKNLCPGSLSSLSP